MSCNGGAIPLPPNRREKMTVEEKILDMLMGAQFDRWYNNQFMDFVEGEEGAQSREEILECIKKMLD